MVSVRRMLAVAALTMGVFGVTAGWAAVTLPALIADNMVLQQGQPVPIWGWADRGEEVIVTVASQKHSAKADDEGRWKVTLEALTPGKPLEMTIKDSSGHSIIVTNVLVGEVWVCSGQSNMEMGIGISKDAQQEIAAADFPEIRLFLVTKAKAAQPARDVKANWAPCTPQSVAAGGWGGFSAAAYFFGREIHKELKVPIGLIETAWGGTPAEFWTSRKTLEANPTLKPLAQGESSCLYNGQLAPLMPYAMKGVIWYQGESNLRRALEYRTLFPAMIENWRADWGGGVFPFGFVQLAPYRYGDQNPANYAELCEAQLLTLKSVPNTGMAVTLDIGDAKDIHPKYKQEVGRRLALWALAKVYGRKGMVYSGPIYKAMTIAGNEIRLTFDHCGGGLKSSDGQPLREFTIAGADQQFVPAKAEIAGDTIVVSSDQVAAPVAVRYAWHDTPQPNLVNQEGLPASLFRTDTWVGSPKPPKSSLYHERLRPKFHITARYWDEYQLHPPNHHEGWLNDMNGLVYNQGEYHFFAQRWWTAWLHMISTDLVHWTELRPVMALERPGDTRGVPFGGTQSGGGVVDTYNSSGLGDGKEPPMLVFWSSTDNLNQCMSYSRDRGRTWTKYEKNPVLVQPERDPNVFWHEPSKKWILIMFGPSSEGGDQRKLVYGFNGEYNDLHNLRDCKAGEWVCSAVCMADDGRVVVMDQRGKASGNLDMKRQNVGADGFRIGAKTDGTEFLDGDIAELVVYDRALSDAEATNVVAGLQAKWKLSQGTGPVTLPAAGMVLHLDASKVEAGSGGAVSVWKDLSGKGNDMKQADASAMPKRREKALGDGPVVSFAGKQFLQGPAVLAAGAKSLTMAAVWRRTHALDSEVVCEQNSASKQAGRRAALMTVSGRAPARNSYLLFSSTNLLQWTKLSSEIPDSFECPDMFELPIEPPSSWDSGAAGADAGRKKWVVIDGNGDYVTGSFDGNAFATESKKGKGDYGRHFYATMTFDNMPASDPRRIQMAWMRGWDDYPKDMPFNQQASFACELTLRKLPQGLVLCRWPIREISGLYCGKPLTLANYTLKPDANPLADFKGDAFDVDLTLDVAKSTCSEVVLTLGGNTVKYDLKQRFLHSVDARIPLEPRSGVVGIRVLLDRLSIETFGNRGEVSITNIAHQKPGTPSLCLAVQGGDAAIVSLSVHEIESMWKNAPK